jgi:hypothetical protein
MLNCGLFSIFFFNGSTAPWGSRPPHCSRLHDHTLETHHTLWDSSGRGASPSQRPLPDNTQHSQETDIHALGGIRTHNPSMRAAVDPRLRLRSHWDRWSVLYTEAKGEGKGLKLCTVQANVKKRFKLGPECKRILN